MTGFREHASYNTADRIADGWIKCRQKYGKASATYEAFGFKDAKGREMGVIVAKQPIEVTPDGVTEYNATFHPGDVGQWIAVSAQTAKNGKAYGASQRGLVFRDHETKEIEDYINKRVFAMRNVAKSKAKS